MDMTKRGLLAGAGAAMTAFLAGCNTLTMFNRFTPKDAATRVAHDVVYRDGPQGTYDVYAPAGAKDLPLLVFFFGGGWYSGQKSDYVWMGHALASLGYVVAIPDYRLVPEVHYPVFLEDNVAAVKHIIAHAADYGADASRLGLSGHSAGAYAAVMLSLSPQFAIFPIKACLGISGPYDFYPFDVKESIDAFSQYPHPLETQPVDLVHKVDTHFLIQQSRSDKTVGPHNAVNLAAKLKAAGDDVTLKLYDGLSHADTAAVFSVPFRGKAPLRDDAAIWLKANL